MDLRFETPGVTWVYDQGKSVRVIYKEPYPIHVGQFSFTAWRHGLYPSSYPNYIVNLNDAVEWEAWQAARNIYQRNEALVFRAMTKARIAQGFDEPANERAGFVYVLRADGIHKLDEQSTGLYKIGRTKDLNDRIGTFAVKLPFEVDYEWVIPTADCFKLESTVHQTFADKRTMGEWFALTVEDLAYIREQWPYGDAFDSFPGA